MVVVMPRAPHCVVRHFTILKTSSNELSHINLLPNKKQNVTQEVAVLRLVMYFYHISSTVPKYSESGITVYIYCIYMYALQVRL